MPPALPQPWCPCLTASGPAIRLLALAACSRCPPQKSWAPKYLIIQPESVRRGPAPRTWLPTSQELCDLLQGAEQAPMESASLPQAAQPPEPHSIHLSAARDKRKIARVPMPCLAAGAKRRLPASSSSPPPKNQGLDSQIPEACTPSGQTSMVTSTVPPKFVAHGPPMQSSQKPIPPKECGVKVPAVTHQRHLSLFMDEGLKFCSSSQEATGKELKEEKAVYQQSSSKRIGQEVATNTFHKMQGLEPGPGAGLHKTRDSRAVSQEVVLGGKLAAQTSFSLQRPDSTPREDPLQGAALYQSLKEHLLTQAQCWGPIPAGPGVPKGVDGVGEEGMTRRQPWVGQQPSQDQ